MVWLHTHFGYLVLAVFIVIAIVAVLSLSRSTNRAVPPVLRRVAMGLLDLQILFGIITLILHFKVGFLYLLHPIVMLVVVGLAHALTGTKKPKRVQVLAYVIVAILMIFGVLIH